MSVCHNFIGDVMQQKKLLLTRQSPLHVCHFYIYTCIVIVCVCVCGNSYVLVSACQRVLLKTCVTVNVGLCVLTNPIHDCE